MGARHIYQGFTVSTPHILDMQVFACISWGVFEEMDKVFKALADPTRRFLLDLLHENNGQTLGELCDRVEMARQSATQHLAVLEAANLVTTVRRGREKLHYLNPVPLHHIQERWIDKFERPRLRLLSSVKRQAEDNMTDKPTYVYVTYIESTPEKVWQALTSADLTAEYWGHRNISDWQVGSEWQHVRTDGSDIADVTGKVLESEPPTRLVSSWADASGNGTGEPTTVTFDIEPYGGIVRLTVTHENLPSLADRDAVSQGWPAVMSNLKSLLETGHVLPQVPWEMPAAVTS
jgi:uncharacterized protein YndB with AHSA1/START domain/DNA-binding transcriptional ArsR family regulator